MLLRSYASAALALSLTCCAEPAAIEPEHEAPTASHGGVRLELGSITGELVVHASGELHFHALGDAELSRAGVTVTLRDASQHPHAIALRFADPVQGFVGHMEAPAPGEAEVLITLDGHRSRATARVSRLLPRPEHEGSIVVAGRRVIEVAVDATGEVRAWSRGAHEDDLDVTAGIPDESGALHPLALAWDASEEAYAGRIEGIVPHAGPLEVIVARGAHEDVGRGSLVAVGNARAPSSSAPDFRLELPELGSHLPPVITVPPAGTNEH